MRKYILPVVVLLLAGCTYPSNLETASTNAPIVTELKSNNDHWEKFLAWWPGDYDNLRQIERLKEIKESEEIDISATALYIRHVNLPAFGDHVYYAEWNRYDEPDNIVRQRFYVFEKDGQTLRLNLHIFPQDAAFRAKTAGAYDEPAKLIGVTPEDMYPLPGCDVYFNWNRDEFSGAMKKNSCNFAAPDSGTPIYSWSQMRLNKGTFQYLDGWFNQDGSHYRQFSEDWVVFEKQ